MRLCFKNFKEVPEWNTYYPSLSEATTEQDKFYNYWLDHLEKGNLIDIKGNLSYIFAYLYSVIKRFIKDKDINRLLKCFEKVNMGYSEYEKIRDYLVYWTSDAYQFLCDYDKAWEVRKEAWKFGKGKELDVSDFMNFRSKCKDTSINGQDLMRMLGSDNSLTEFGKNYQEQVANLSTIFLNDFYKEHGKNLIEYFCRQFDFSNLTEDDFLRLKEFYPNEKDFFFWREMYDRKEYPYVYGHYLFGGVPLSTPYIECEAIPYIITVASTNEAKRILRESENTLREEKNLPKVGEGWISETELFYKLCEEFPNEKIVHHGRPTWLSPQHIDIYFPMRNIAIEYQGSQHQNPVEYFGGEKAFEEQQKLDRRKKRLCERYECKLIYIYEEYNFEDIKQKIKDMLIDY